MGPPAGTGGLIQSDTDTYMKRSVAEINATTSNIVSQSEAPTIGTKIGTTYYITISWAEVL